MEAIQRHRLDLDRLFVCCTHRNIWIRERSQTFPESIFYLLCLAEFQLKILLTFSLFDFQPRSLIISILGTSSGRNGAFHRHVKHLHIFVLPAHLPSRKCKAHHHVILHFDQLKCSERLTFVPCVLIMAHAQKCYNFASLTVEVLETASRLT